MLQEGVEGQTRLVRQPNGKILCYQWTKGNWECVGDVMGAAGGTQETSGKSLHEGKEYDFVFNVDIEDGKPPLKLPFNTTEDPWLSAQKFIHKNDLPQAYLEQVANFIIQNAKLTSLPAASTNEGFVDPFTGGGRYVPNSNGNGDSQASAPSVDVNFRERSNNSAAVNLDPFTGGSSYSSGKQDKIVKKHIPFTILTTFDSCDSTKVLIKLKEFNNQFIEDKLKATEAELEDIIQLISSKSPRDESIKNLRKVMSWPDQYLFPVLDIIRLSVRHETTCAKLGAIELVDYIIQRLLTTPANQLMSIRALCNMMLHETGKSLVEIKMNDLCNMISNISQGTVNLQSAIVTFYLNQSIVQKGMLSDEISTILTIGIIRILEWVSDPEATSRGYQALGNLLTYNSTVVLPIVKSAETLKNALERNRNALYEKLAEISSELTENLL